ncbi:prepilin-type N-terminal cleavage/methylation domain-containing protein [Candidatus Peregrinibacteria bacterium]|jgi:prepilin-type N-terminal cleavage/methylation domain-containing protein|nr:prepilin-type N-terminal cleavage/methylation domain-containing protein [Candidatus Peregrinibacteria bacterium]MBT4148725.1 prepilin-type N-terminal cleavage/methylation domain-containing protein [Candidatus Peregrinibacteria bacterium]MBT4366216.1 prepilin-type N-terminal cleavage/methylation domain-containing protein [Candidatus Peregrinibacteria bacterium]MBT4456276.1 prepilin-type N-terminal cleavage/methylation domain-containing protein [Candidatus Peregrinibacteria bacterium]
MKRNLSPIPKGFTLIEILIVVTIVAILSTSALVGLVRIQDHFEYQASVNKTVSLFKEIRSLALGNATVENPAPEGGQIVPFQYGAHVDLATKTVTTFADMPSGNKWEFEPAADPVFGTYQLGDKFDYTTQNEKDVENVDMTIFYEPTTGDFSIKQIGTFDGRFVSLRIYDIEKEDRQKYLVFFRISGTPEEMDSLDAL